MASGLERYRKRPRADDLEHPLKKPRRDEYCDRENMTQNWVNETAGMKENLERIASEVRDINSTLQELLHEIQQRP